MRRRPCSRAAGTTRPRATACRRRRFAVTRSSRGRRAAERSGMTDTSNSRTRRVPSLSAHGPWPRSPSDPPRFLQIWQPIGNFGILGRLMSEVAPARGSPALARFAFTDGRSWANVTRLAESQERACPHRPRPTLAVIMPPSPRRHMLKHEQPLLPAGPRALGRPLALLVGAHDPAQVREAGEPLASRLHDLSAGATTDAFGEAVTAAGVGFAISVRRELGGNWSSGVTIKEGHSLARSGLYALSRNPICSGFIGAALGTAIAVGQMALPRRPRLVHGLRRPQGQDRGALPGRGVRDVVRRLRSPRQVPHPVSLVSAK